jgi:signal transduction histidine kinase
VYGILSAVIVGLYVLVVGGLGALIHANDSGWLAVLATGLVAILFVPLRERLQRAVNRLMYGERDDPLSLLERLGDELRAVVTPRVAMQAIADTLVQTLKLPYAAIELVHSDEGERVASAGLANSARRVTFPIEYQSGIIGALVVSPRAPNEPLTTAEQRLLKDIAQQAGMVAHVAQITAELKSSRERIVTAREEERRRLRRDLHDELGPTLAGQALKLDAVLEMLSDPSLAQHPTVERVRGLLTDLQSKTQATVADIRRLVYELRPPALDELGLAGALSAQFNSFSANGLEIAIETTPSRLPPLPAAHEAAAYRIALEAVTNVVRHAHARHCWVRLVLDKDLSLEIRDDGVGVSGTSVGIGLNSMRERAAELGGTCQIDSTLGGTTIRARLPISG